MAEQEEVRTGLVRQLKGRAAKLDATEFMPGWRDVMEEAFPEIDAWYAEHPIVVNTPKMPRLDEGLSADLMRYIQIARDNPGTLKGALAQSLADTRREREEKERALRQRLLFEVLHRAGGPVRLGP